MDFSAQLFARRPRITVDGNGGLLPLLACHRGLTLLLVGMIQRQTVFLEGTPPDDTLGIAPPAPLSTHSGTEHGTTNKAVLLEPSPPSRLGHTGITRTTEGGNDGDIPDGYKGSSGGESGGQRKNEFDHQRLAGVSSILTPPPRSPLRPKLSRDRNRLKPYSPAVTPLSQVVDLGLSSTPPSDLHMGRTRPLAPKFGRNVVSSILTDTATYSSLLDPNRGGVGGGRFGTVRTATTEATSYLDSDSLSGGDLRAPGSQDRKPGESASVDLTRVPRETESGMANRIRPRGKSSNGEDGWTRALHAVRLGKGKWPDDFFPHGSLSPGNNLSESPRNPTPLSTTPPRKSAIVGRANGSTESLSQFPRRPSHRQRYSLDAPPTLLPRDASPGGRTSLSASKIIVPCRVTQSRSSGLLGRNSMDNERRPALDARVPFPRAVSATRGQSRRDNVTSDQTVVAEVEPWVTGRSMVVRGRTQSEIDSSSSKRKSRPISSDLSGRNPRRSRFESMVNLGVTTDTASANDLPNRNAQGDNKIRPLLVVKEEGKSATQFVSIFFRPYSSLFPFRLWGSGLVCLSRILTSPPPRLRGHLSFR